MIKSIVRRTSTQSENLWGELHLGPICIADRTCVAQMTFSFQKLCNVALNCTVF